MRRDAAPRSVLSEPVARALRDGEPVVALESTIITHGLPRAREPAGRARVRADGRRARRGAGDDRDARRRRRTSASRPSELERLAGSEAALKLSVRDLPVAMAQGATGGTTVAATALLASQAGIRVFATGGIGGVHRDAGTTFDESADLGDPRPLPDHGRLGRGQVDPRHRAPRSSGWRP